MNYTHVLVFEKLMVPKIGDDDIPEAYWQSDLIWIDGANHLYWLKQYQKMCEDKQYRNVHIFKLS